MITSLHHASLLWRFLLLAIVCLLGGSLWAAEQATPAANAAQWLSDPDSSLVAVLHLAGSLVQAVQTISWQSWLMGAAGVAVGIFRLTPGWGPAIGWLYDNVLAKRKDVAAERAEVLQAEGFRFLVGAIENLPPGTTLAQARDKFARKMPERIKEAVKGYLDQNGRALTVVSPWPFAGADGIAINPSAPSEAPKA